MLSLKAFLGLDGTGFEQGIKRAESTAKAFSKTISHEITGKLGSLFALGAVEEGLRKTIEYGSHVQDLSDRLGISTDAVQRWDYALSLAGSSIDSAAGFFEKLGIARQKALGGDEASSNAFRNLGISAPDLKSMRVEDIGAKIDETVKGGDIQKIIGDLREVGGKSAGELVAAFKGTFSEDMGNAPLIKAEDIVELDKIGDQLTMIGKKTISELAPIAIFLGKMFKGIYEDVEDVVTAIGAFTGALANGMSFKEARDITRESMDELKAKRASDSAAIEAKPRGLGQFSNDENKADKKTFEDRVKQAEKLADLQRKNSLDLMSKEKAITELIKEREDILKNGYGTMEEAIKAEELRGEINRRIKGQDGESTKLNLTSNQMAGAQISFVPKSDSDYLTRAIRDNTDATKLNTNATAKKTFTKAPEGFGVEQFGSGVEY